MTNRRTAIGTAWALRAAVLVAGLVAAIGLPGTAGAATPSSPSASSPAASSPAASSPSETSHGDASTTRTARPSRAAKSSDTPTPTTPAETDTRTTPPSRAAKSSDTPAPTTPAEADTRTLATPPSSEPDAASTTPTTATPPVPAGDEAGWVLAVRPAALTVREGQIATFTATFTRSGPSASPITVRWQTARARKGPWTDLSGSTSTVVASTATLMMDGDLFRAVVSTDQESSRSPAAILHVQSPLDTPSAIPAATTPLAKEPYGTVALPILGMGQEQTATGHNFTPGTLVKVTVEPTGVDLGTYVADPDGVVTTRFTTRSLPPGSNTVRWTPLSLSLFPSHPAAQATAAPNHLGSLPSSSA